MRIITLKVRCYPVGTVLHEQIVEVLVGPAIVGDIDTGFVSIGNFSLPANSRMPWEDLTISVEQVADFLQTHERWEKYSDKVQAKGEDFLNEFVIEY